MNLDNSLEQADSHSSHTKYKTPGERGDSSSRETDWLSNYIPLPLPKSIKALSPTSLYVDHSLYYYSAIPLYSASDLQIIFKLKEIDRNDNFRFRASTYLLYYARAKILP
jgi:hypothetical protein